MPALTLHSAALPASASILVLDAELFSRIAAGEVVERPASILKELVENALDAGANSVRAALEDGGLKLVRVSDDGTGMSPSDLSLSVLPHATSKVSSASDLDQLADPNATLGFRGEALPSIASVTRLKLVSRQRGSDGSGWALEPSVASGDVSQMALRPAASAYGTTVEASDEFFALPARRKFLKSPGSEAAACAEAFVRLSLTRPHVRFELLQGRYELLNLPALSPSLSPTQAFFQRARAALGQPSSVLLHELDCSDSVQPGSEAYRIYGLLSAPSHSRSNRSLIYLTVNGRAVKDRTLTSALLEACRHFLPPRRFPLAALWVSVPPSEVDINVHPAKAEVRFRAPARLYSLLHHAVRQAYGVDALQEGRGARDEGRGNTFPAKPAEALLAFRPAGPLLANAMDLSSSAESPPSSLAPRPSPLLISEAPAPFGVLASASRTAALPAPTRGDFRVIGQAAASYIVVEDESGLHVIDQHALHERILFERLLKQARSSARGDSQALLVPIPVELSAPQAAVLSSASSAEPRSTESISLEWLAELGFDCAPFGARTLLVQAVPAILPAHLAAKALTDLLDELADPELTGRASLSSNAPGAARSAGRWTLREKAAYVLSCKAALKAGERLTVDQMSALIGEFCALSGTRSLSGRLTCPHGRPLALELSWQDIQHSVGR